METKLILIEGIPGSGKTSFARKTADWYKDRGITANLYVEGQSHPADLAWNACVPFIEYDKILQCYAPIRNEIQQHTVIEGDFAIIAYTQVKSEDFLFYKELEKYEIYDGRVPDEVFYNLHYQRWRSFGLYMGQKDGLCIFECAFLQNHVNEMLFWRNAGDDAVIAHHNRLINSVMNLSPVLIYLSQPDIRETINRIANERISNEHGNWIDKCISYCENSPYGKQNGIKGFDGAMKIFAIRKQLEMKILSQLPIPYIIIENKDYDWDAVWGGIEKYLLSLE